LVPGLIDIYVKGAPQNREVTTARVVDASHEATGEQKIAELAAKHVDFLFIPADVSSAAADSILEESRKYNIPVTAGVTTLAQAQHLVKSGAGALAGMIADTEDIDQAFLAKLRSLKVVFAPGLAAHSSEAAKHNTRRMASAGVPIAVGSGGDSLRELE